MVSFIALQDLEAKLFHVTHSVLIRTFIMQFFSKFQAKIKVRWDLECYHNETETHPGPYGE